MGAEVSAVAPATRPARSTGQTTPDPNPIPLAMRSVARWVVWRFESVTNRETGEIRRTKVPYQARSPKMKASTTDPRSWGTYAQAMAAVTQADTEGVGFVLGDGWAGIDLDHCRDAATGAIEAWAAEIVAEMATYTEISPSGSGLHLLLRATMAGGRRCSQMEVYGASRYFTVTGERLAADTPLAAESRQAQLDALVARHFAPKPQIQARAKAAAAAAPSAGTGLADSELLEVARARDTKFAALWAGDTSAYDGDHSRADAALCMKLAFYTGRDARRMDALFRRSGLMRDKWDARRGDSTYGEREIANAVSLQADVYTPSAITTVSSAANTAKSEHSEFSETGHGAAVGRGSLNSLNSQLAEHEEEDFAEWPDPMRDAAYIGPIGDFVRKLAPQTEAAREALLIQALVAAGSAMGRHGHVLAEETYHHTNLFAVVVAGTGARKGVSWGRVRRFLGRAVGAEWLDEHIVGGLSSGEGLINAVRDAGPMIPDKVALAYESEFAAVFKTKGRDGSTLSTVMRQAWDGDALHTLTKNSPLRATGAHISIIGHITPDELRRMMTETDATNGFANRILWVCVKRARYLPDGGEDVNLNAEVEALQNAIEYGRSAGHFKRDAEARALWHSRYRDLSSGRPGQLGAVTNRAEAQVTRLSLLYALLDRSPGIQRRHLEAALAVWDYCLASAAFLFGDALGDPDAEELYAELCTRGQEGMSKSDMFAHFRNHRSAKQIGAALGVLAGQGKAEKRPHKHDGGRTVDRWYALEGVAP